MKLNKLRSKLPHLFKVILRLFRYSSEWSKQLREIGIKNKQSKWIKSFSPNEKNIILFLIPGGDYKTGKDSISGGMISVFSIYKETISLKEVHKSITLMSTLPEHHLIFKYLSFANDTSILSFNRIVSHFKKIENLIIHIPEMYIISFLNYLETAQYSWLTSIKHSHLNILNQSIHLMPEVNTIQKIQQYFSLTTITTAHQQYCNQYYYNSYKLPLHKLSVWISPEQYVFKKKSEKENLLVYSPDPHPNKEQIIKELSKIKDLKLQMIEGLTYDEYKETISRAKWAITFGEGLDGYFIEPIFSGAIGFAVYNQDFFTSDFKSLKTIYPSYDVMIENIISDIRYLESSVVNFDFYQKQQFTICAAHYSSKEYTKNIEKFYNSDYTFK